MDEQQSSNETADFVPSIPPFPAMDLPVGRESRLHLANANRQEDSWQNSWQQGTETATPCGATGESGANAPAGGTPRLQVDGEIARGGMGAILKARDLTLGRDIAVKVLLESHAGKTEFARRFLEEARIAGQLQHPGIVPVYELGVLPDHRPYFTMKLVKGQTLADLLAARKDLLAERPRFLGIFAQVCQTLAYAHARGVIHRDLKPSNVMVGAFGEVQVMDWGLAKVLSEGGAAQTSREGARAETGSVIRTQRMEEADPDSYTQAGMLLGTPAYLAPEQARGDVELVDERADVFGLGAILCEVLTGAPPFLGKGAEATRKAQTGQLEDAYARLEACGTDAELIALAKRCLAAEPWQRPRQAGEVAAAVTSYEQTVADRLRQAELERAAADARAVEEGRTRQMAEAKAVEERKRRRLTVALAAAMLLLVLGGVGGWLWVNHQRETRLEETARLVDRAISEAQLLRGQAESSGDLARWAEARADAQRAEELAASGAASPSLRQRTRDFLDDIERAAEAAKARAAQADKDRRLIAQLLEIRSGAGDQMTGGDQDFAATDARYTKTVQNYGINIDELDSRQARDWLAKLGEGVRVELAACLDDWAHARHMISGNLAWAMRPTQIARLLDPDPLRNDIRAAIAGRKREVLQELASRPEVQAALPTTVNLLAVYLGFSGDARGAIELLKSAQRYYPGDFQINHNLGFLLLYRKPVQPVEALRFSTAALAARPQSLAARVVMADAYLQTKRFAEGAALYRDLIRLQPQPWFSARLGEILVQHGKPDEAIEEYRKAVQLDPKSEEAHANLGHALAKLGKLDEAIAEHFQALTLNPKDDGTHLWWRDVIQFFARQGRLEEVRAAWQKALDRNPPDHRAWFGYAELCLYLDREEEYRRTRTTLLARFGDTTDLQIAERMGRTCLLRPAEGEELRRAAALADRAAAAGPTHRLYPYFELVRGLAEYRRDRLKQAISLLEKCVLPFEQPTPRLVLAMALARSGRPEDARRTLDAAIAPHSWDEVRVTNIDDWIFHILRREAEELIVPNLSAFLQSQYQPRDNKERLGLVGPCRFRKRYLAAVQLYEAAFADDPQLVDDWKAAHRYNAACVAALTGWGRGEDAKQLDAKARARWCQQAVNWLRDDLTVFTNLLANGKPEERELVRRRLSLWKSDGDLAGIRDKNSREKLPAEMQTACNNLWSQVEALSARGFLRD